MRHGELEVRIFAHQVQYAAESIPNDFHSFRPRPQPSHVNVRIAHRANRELLKPGIKNFQSCVRLFQRRIESSLVSGEVDGLYARIEQCLTLRFTFGPGGTPWPRRK